MIDSGVFDKKDISNWEDNIQADKIWAEAKEYFQNMVTIKERYASMTLSTTKKTRFKSTAQVNKRNDNKIDKGERLCVCLNSISAAATASNKRIQELKGWQQGQG